MIRVEKRGRVTIVTMDRPERRNALDAAAQAEMAAAFDAFAADPEQWVAILTGAGEQAFSAGHDLKTPPPEGPTGLPATGFGGITARYDLDKPVIAAVNGFAVGGGFEMALACDIVIAAPRASFALPEVKVGMAALGGGILRLPRMIGMQRAMGLMLTGRKVSAEEGLAMGFVTEVAEDALAAALRWAEALLAASPLAVRATKAVALGCADEPLETAMDRQWTLPAVARMQESEDKQEGPAAFNERRSPVWKGR
jgi:enoyl-CoA hydratase/carnithine racemase